MKLETIVKKNERCASEIAKSLEKYLEADSEIAQSVAALVISQYYGFKLSNKDRFFLSVKNTFEWIGDTWERIWFGVAITGITIGVPALAIILVVFVPAQKYSFPDSVRFEPRDWGFSSCLGDRVCIDSKLVKATNSQLDGLQENEEVTIDKWTIKHQGKSLVFSQE